MADYRKMYYVLCKAIDDVIDPLDRIPLAKPYAEQLQKALLALLFSFLIKVFLCAGGSGHEARLKCRA